MKKYLLPIIMLLIFETVAISLWLSKDNLFYLINFTYIGFSIAIGLSSTSINISMQDELLSSW